MTIGDLILLADVEGVDLTDEDAVADFIDGFLSAELHPEK